MNLNVRAKRILAVVAVLSLSTIAWSTTVSFSTTNNFDEQSNEQLAFASTGSNTTTATLSSLHQKYLSINLEQNSALENSETKKLLLAGFKIPFSSSPNPGSLLLFISGFICFLGLGWIKKNVL